MSGGVSYRSKSAVPSWSVSAGTAVGNYPVSNMGDLVSVSKVTRIAANASGVIGIRALFADPQTVQFVGLVNHTIPSTASVQLRIYSDAFSTLVYNSGSIALGTAGAGLAGYRNTRPWVLPNALTNARGIFISVFSLAAAQQIEAGGMEIGEWWGWDFSPGADLGFRARQPKHSYLGGAAEVEDTPLGRAFNGQLDLLGMATAQSTGLEFQKDRGLTKPFVFVPDFADPTTWPRGCFLARNQAIPGSVGAMYRHDRFQLRFVEHWR